MRVAPFSGAGKADTATSDAQHNHQAWRQAAAATSAGAGPRAGPGAGPGAGACNSPHAAGGLSV